MSPDNRPLRNERLPIAHVLPGINIHELPQYEQIGFVFTLIKYAETVNPEIDEWCWAFRTSAPYSHEELLGALLVQVKLLEEVIIDRWEGEEKEDAEETGD